VHKVVEGRVFERLISLDGSGREIIRKDDEVRCVLQQQKSVVVEKRESSPLLSSLPDYQAALDDYYHFKIVGRDRVASRDARIIEVRPRDEYRYGHRLWLDEETAMPLRSALISNSGAVIEQVLFTSIRLGESISDEALQPRLSAEGFKWIVEEQSEETSADESAWQAETLPRGFKLTVARTHGMQEQKPDQYVYTDGLASVSVFVEPAPEGAKPINGLSTIGSANAYATTISGYQVTAVGEVPPSTVEMIGASLKRKE
ncbi:MAG: MucB/RseB C-terminal domain-containing protein, partial [Gammaproteobacteria bacterium]|nr:MucB/RseB C-terminal domain-containing protein [Gammaproteobacteria bacterium]